MCSNRPCSHHRNLNTNSSAAVRTSPPHGVGRTQVRCACFPRKAYRAGWKVLGPIDLLWSIGTVQVGACTFVLKFAQEKG